ncbi:MAG: DNA polymerase III subunit gamma/tau [Candidatus Dormibacteria bacterium]
MNSVRQSLYLKYRPQRFDALVGQEVVSRTLRNAVRERRLGHAYLFTGIRGTGKTSAARILARAINCEHPEEGEPCGVCHACESVGAGRSLDVIEIDAATNRGIDEIRDLRERTQFLPSELRTKVYIIDEAHMLTTEAGNAFLKTLEEPPEHACFILATTEPQRLSETILSRCQRFDFRRIPAAAMAAHLAQICRQEGVETTPEVMALVAEAGAGSLRDAESLLDRLLGLEEGVLGLDSVRAALGMADPYAIGRLITGMSDGDVAGAWSELRQLEAAGVEPRQLLRSLGAEARARQWEALAHPQGQPGGRFWLELMEACTRGGSELRRADDPWMALEVILLKVASPAVRRTPSARSGVAITVDLGPPSAPPGALPPVGRVPVVAQGPAAEAAVPEDQAGAPASSSGATSGTPGEDGGGTTSPALAAGAPTWRTRWPEVVDWAQHHHPGPFTALAKETKPVALNDGKLTIEVRYEWHLGKLREPQYRALLEEACAAVLGEGIAVDLQPAGRAASPGDDGGPEPAAGGGALAAVLKHFPGSTVRKVEFLDPH